MLLSFRDFHLYSLLSYGTQTHSLTDQMLTLSVNIQKVKKYCTGTCTMYMYRYMYIVYV